MALQIGHRDSVDFDFFTENHFDTFKLYTEILEVFSGDKVLKILDEKDSLSGIINGEIKLSILGYPYMLIKPAIDEKYLRIASIEDIGCMKLLAITNRSAEKDYVDLYFILKRISLKELLSQACSKMPDLDQNLILKSLVYFDDIIPENIIFKNNSNVQFSDVKAFLKEQVISLQLL